MVCLQSLDGIVYCSDCVCTDVKLDMPMVKLPVQLVVISEKASMLRGQASLVEPLRGSPAIIPYCFRDAPVRSLQWCVMKCDVRIDDSSDLVE